MNRSGGLEETVRSRTDMVTGGCGFVGRHLVKRLLQDGRSVLIVDDLSTGLHPDTWLQVPRMATTSGLDSDLLVTYQLSERQQVRFARRDLIAWLLDERSRPSALNLQFDDVFHLASVVGGRAKIDGDPMAVAIDLAIDAAFFRWIVAHKDDVGRVLYASSSAAYPVQLQGAEGAVSLAEDMIEFGSTLGQPDMTYGWSKLTGEYLARIASQHYGVHVACVRPFSGYGGDQDQTYPVPAIARRAARGEDPLVVWGTGLQGRDFVHIDDCIEAMLHGIEKISDGSAVNIGTGRLTNFLEVAALFARLAGYAPRIQPMVDRPMGVMSRYADPRRMREVLDWYPSVSLEDGFRRVLEEQAAALAAEREAERGAEPAPDGVAAR